jgi:arylformamidase
VDLPRHLFAQGQTADQAPVSSFIGKARVLREDGEIGPGQLERLPDGCEILLLASAQENWLSAEGAEYLIGKVKGVGTQSSSIDPKDSVRLPAHRLLLGAGIWIVENLNLAAAPEEFLYVGPPVALTGAGAAWARPVGMDLSAAKMCR